MDEFDAIIGGAFPDDTPDTRLDITGFPERFTDGMAVLQWGVKHRDRKTRITAYSLLYQLRDQIDAVIASGKDKEWY